MCWLPGSLQTKPQVSGNLVHIVIYFKGQSYIHSVSADTESWTILLEIKRSRNENVACGAGGFGMMSVRFGSRIEGGHVPVFVFWGSGYWWWQKGVSHLSAKRRSPTVLICTGLDRGLFCVSLLLNSNTECSCCHGPFVTQLPRVQKRNEAKRVYLQLSYKERPPASTSPKRSWASSWDKLRSFCGGFKPLLNSADSSQSSHRVFVWALSSV